MTIEFENAIERVKKLENISNENKLYLYGLYKQINIGDINIKQPYFFNKVALYKWKSWNANKGMSKEESIKKYIEFVDELCKK